MTMIAPSILACEFSQLGDEIRAVTGAGADAIHVDVMDGHFVPNLSIGVPIVQSIRPITALPLDCHLMITNPADFIEPFARAGADWISVHAEVCDLAATLPKIRANGCLAGVVLNPDTSIDCLLPHLELMDYILLMSVHPGFAGQTFLLNALKKIQTLRQTLDQRALKIPIQVDGGVNTANARDIIAAGASILVAGNAVFKSTDYAQAIRQLRGS